MAKTDPLQLISESDPVLQARWDRMDVDKDFLFGKKYIMRHPDTKRPIPNVHNVTLPFPSIFYSRIVALLGSSNQQVEVEGDSLTDKQTTTIESFLDDLDYEVDTKLEKRGLISAALLQWQRICARGVIGARCCIRTNGKTFTPDILPLDMRFCRYRYATEGLAWIAPSYKRTKQAIQDEYDIEITQKTGEVTDFWDEGRNVVFIDKIPRFEQKNPYGYVPYVVTVAPTGYWLEDEDAAAYQGESILGIARDIIPEANHFGSIWATITHRSFNNNLQYASKLGTTATPPEVDELGETVVHPVDIGGGYTAMPLTDVSRAAQLWWNILNELLQMATISNANYGVLQFPLSGVAISSMTEAKDKILVPCLQGYSIYKRALAEMAIRQMIDFKMSAELGQSGHKRNYSYRELKGDYSINYRFFSTSKEQQVADATISNAMGDNVSQDFKRREIFKLQDPDGEHRKIEIERLERTDPFIQKKMLVHSLIDEDRDIEARIVLHELVTMIRQKQVGMVNEKPTQAPQKDLLPLFEAGGTRSRVPAPTSE